jgi:hypothetical protein
MTTWVWAEEGGVEFSADIEGNGLVVCRIMDDGKEIAKASIAFYRWERLMAAMSFRPFIKEDHEIGGWIKTVPTSSNKGPKRNTP